MLLQFIFGFYSWFFSFFSHLSFSTTLQFVLHNSVGWGRVCVSSYEGVFLVYFFRSVCSNVAKYSDKKSLTNPIPKWGRGENHTYTLSRNVKKCIVCVCLCDFTLQCDVPTKQTNFFSYFFSFLKSLSSLATTKISPTLLFLLLMQPLFLFCFYSCIFVYVFGFLNFRFWSVRNWFA